MKHSHPSSSSSGAIGRPSALSMMASSLSSPFVLIALVLSYVVVHHLRRRRHLPPGPPADPLVGHLRLFNNMRKEEVLLKWHKQHGDVVYLNILGREIILLNSYEAASELLDGKAKIYSDRPPVPFMSFIGWGKVLPMLRYGSEFHKSRKLFTDYLPRHPCPKFWGAQLRQTHIALKKLLHAPENLNHYLERYGGAVVVDITYGHQILTDDDPYIEFTEVINNLVVLQGQSGAHPVDMFPWLRFLPAWFPGASFVRFAQETRKTLEVLKRQPVEAVERDLVEGTTSMSFVSQNLEKIRQKPNYEEDVELLKNAALIFYAGGAESTSVTIETILLALLLNPEAQKKAQQEIDKVLEQKRLPEFADRESLPYVEYVIQEGIRWHPAFPLGVPHRAMVDDVYKGMQIPKGSIIIPNVTCMTKDERVYRNPSVFYPERYMDAPEGYGEPNPNTALFGFGRRSCPGRFLAEDSVWIIVANILAAFEITPIQDKDGKDVLPIPEFSDAITSRPKPFKCNVRPRSSQMKALVEQL